MASDSTFNVTAGSLTLSGALNNPTTLANIPQVAITGAGLLRYGGGNYSYQTSLAPGASLAVTNGRLNIAANGTTGSLTQNGGTVSSSDWFTVAADNNSAGTYNLSSGTMTTTGRFAVAMSGGSVGTVNQSGGTVTIVNNEMTLGENGRCHLQPHCGLARSR